MRQRMLSLALSVGLLAASVGPAVAQTGGGGAGQGTGERSREREQSRTHTEMVQAMQNFCNYTQQNWSQLGFDSAAQARSSLGGDWFTEVAQALGYTTANVCTQISSATPAGGQSSQ